MINYPAIDDIVSDHENDIIDESSKSIKGQKISGGSCGVFNFSKELTKTRKIWNLSILIANKNHLGIRMFSFVLESPKNVEKTLKKSWKKVEKISKKVLMFKNLEKMSYHIITT